MFTWIAQNIFASGVTFARVVQVSEPTSSPAWDQAVAGWDHATPPLWRRHSDAVNERLIDRWLPHAVGSVLKTDLFDELVSPGLYPALAARAGAVAGIDISPETVAGARRRHPELEATVASVTDLPFETARFDAVVSNSTLDHLALSGGGLGRIRGAGPGSEAGEERSS